MIFFIFYERRKCRIHVNQDRKHFKLNAFFNKSKTLNYAGLCHPPPFLKKVIKCPLLNKAHR